jgi:hypothetical protein
MCMAPESYNSSRHTPSECPDRQNLFPETKSVRDRRTFLQALFCACMSPLVTTASNADEEKGEGEFSQFFKERITERKCASE